MDVRLNKRKLVLVIVDSILIAFSYYTALLLRLNFNISATYISRYVQIIIAVIGISLIVFYYFGLYNRLWRYASINELKSITIAVTLSTTLAGLFSWSVGAPFPRTSYVIAGLLKAALIGGSRFYLRLAPNGNNFNKAAFSPVLIIGAGQAGTMVARELRSHHTPDKALPVGFVDDDPDKQNCNIDGITVLGTREEIPSIVQKHKIEEIIIAIPSAPHSEIRQLARLCSHLPAKVKILPGVYEILNGQVSVSSLRPVQIEDLLGREEVKVDLQKLSTYLLDKTILVTGAGGSIGSELCRQISFFNPGKLLVLDHAENNVYDIEMELNKSYPHIPIIPIVADVRDAPTINHIFSTHKPTVVFHAAAHKHVPLMEQNREEAIRNNIFGTKNVAEAADRHHAKSFTLVSTDKAVNPASVMGATKRMAEIVIQMLSRHSSTRFCAVRFGNVLGSSGSVVPLFQKQISQGGPVTVTHPEMTRYFMTTREAVQLVIEAGSMGKKGEIFVLDMGEPVKILDLATDIIKLSGLEPHKDMKITYTGIRPGEKLYEEVLTSEEGTQSTKHERIYIAKASSPDPKSLSQELSSLSQLLSYDLDLYYKQNLSAIRSLG